MMEEAMDLNNLHDAVAPGLDRLAGLEVLARTLEGELNSDPRYTQLADIRLNIGVLEDQIKDILKASGAKSATIQNAGYEAILQTRKGKETLHFDIQAIEQEPTLATCIIKSVNERLFKAVVEAKSLDMSMYCTPEAGTEVKAVIIRKVDDKKP
jgi:hypothetical protein